jgi:lysophospholipase L1-like esterase
MSDPSTAPLSRLRQRIAEKTADRSAPPILIVALGDSVTQGVMGYNDIAHEYVYHARFRRGLEDRYPLCTFSVINAGVDGQTAADGRQRLHRDVLRYDPDLVLISFGPNDAVLRGRDQVPAFGDDLRSMVESIRRETQADVVLLTPNRMASHDNDRVPTVYRKYVEIIVRVQTDGTLDRFAEEIRRVGESRRVPVADVYRAWCQLEADGVDTTAMLINGLNHPAAADHRIAADLLLKLVDESAAAAGATYDRH